MTGRGRTPASLCPHRPGVLSFQGLAPVPAWTTSTHTHEVLSPTPRSTSLPIGRPLEPPGHLPVSCPMRMPDPSLEPFLPAVPAAHTTPSPPPSFPTRPSAVASGPGSYGPSRALQSSPQPELEKCKSDRMASGLGLHRAFPWLSGQKSKVMVGSSCKTEVENRREQSLEGFTP